MTTTHDPLLGFSPSDIVIGPGGQTLEDVVALTVKLHLADPYTSVTLTGDRKSVLRVIALSWDLSGEDSVDIRPCTGAPDSLVVVDCTQAESCPAVLADVVGKDNYR